jgi:hypothetical protein
MALVLWYECVPVRPFASNFLGFLLPRPECATFDLRMLCGTALVGIGRRLEQFGNSRLRPLLNVGAAIL